VRTTLDLDEDVVQAARALAELEGVSIGRAVSRLARAGLETRRSVRAGRIPTFPPRPGAPPITPEKVRAAMDDQ
jgi:hypothetical protein